MARILVDIRFADSGQPLSSNVELARLAPDVWRGGVPPLPRNQQPSLRRRALSASGGVAFSGEPLATLTVCTRACKTVLAPTRNDQTFHMPRMFRIVYPA